LAAAGKEHVKALETDSHGREFVAQNVEKAASPGGL